MNTSFTFMLCKSTTEMLFATDSPPLVFKQPSTIHYQYIVSLPIWTVCE
jgi:hypothetical protein